MSKKIELTAVQRFYIDGHVGKKTEAEIAQDLGLNLRTVQAYLRSKERAATAPAPPTAKTSFAEYNGSVAMTGAQSQADDEAAPAVNTEFFKTVQESIHIIDPAKPVR
jgi:predicted transcriptional regulator